MRIEELVREVRPLARVLAGAVALLIGCGGASVDPDGSSPSGSSASSGGASSGGAGASSGAAPLGGSAGSGGVPPWTGTAAGKVDIGACVFEDPGVELMVRYQILQADNLDGAADGSVGPEVVTYLSVSQETLSLAGLECLTNLEDLSLSVYGESAPPTSLAPIAGLSHLRSLYLYGPFEFTGALAGLPLDSLTLNKMALSDLEAVAAPAALRSLRISSVPLTSLKGAEGLAALELLAIEDAKLTDLSPLAATSNLSELELSDIPELKSLAGIEAHTNLEQLSVSDVPLESLVPLGGAAGLERVSIWNSQVSSLNGLEGKLGLYSVTVSNASVSDISALSGLSALATLELARNAIDDLSPLSPCTELRNLDVRGNALESLSPIASLDALETLYVADNALTAIDIELPGTLTSLSIANNRIASLAFLGEQPLAYLDISSNPLESLTPLFELTELVSLIADDIGATDLDSFPLATLHNLSLQNNLIESLSELHGLSELSVDLTGNQVVSLPVGFVGPFAPCGGLVLDDNPLDAAAKARLEALCAEGAASYSWDGGSCDACPRV